jgi:phospholipid/cholesterol/gamma-HCH transport system substrate-binding protein
MKRAGLLTATVATALTGAVLIAATSELGLQDISVGRTVSGPSYPVTAVFRDVAGLPLGGQVRIGQAIVGRVRSMSTQDYIARVELDISEGVRIPVGTTAEMQLTSALGEQFILLSPPPAAGGGDIQPGGEIPLPDTARGPDIENTLAALGAMLGGSGLDQAKTIITEVNTALSGREGRVRDLIDRLEMVLGSVDQHRADLEGLLVAMDRFAAQLADARPMLDDALTRLRPAIDVLLSQRDQFTGLLSDVTSLSKSTNGVLRQTGDLGDQVQRLMPVLETLEGFDSRLGSTLAALNKFTGLFGQSIPGDYLNLDGALDIPGTIYNLLTGTAPLPATPPGGLGSLLSGGTR